VHSMATSAWPLQDSLLMREEDKQTLGGCQSHEFTAKDPVPVTVACITHFIAT
jgi:hypothetical protein